MIQIIYTSYFGKLKQLPKYIVPIAICGKSPDWYKGLEFKLLAPKYWFFQEWKKNHDNEMYIECFNREILNKLHPYGTVLRLKQLANSEDFALICYEKPGDFCHRHLVSRWLNEGGYPTEEFSVIINKK